MEFVREQMVQVQLNLQRYPVHEPRVRGTGHEFRTVRLVLLRVRQEAPNPETGLQRPLPAALDRRVAWTLFRQLRRRVLPDPSRTPVLLVCFRLRTVNHQCMKIDTTKENYDHYYEVVDHKHCNHLRKPPDHEPCQGLCESTRWEYTSWSEVSTEVCRFRVLSLVAVFGDVRRRDAAPQRQVRG